jgi:hypothetical protein
MRRRLLTLAVLLTASCMVIIHDPKVDRGGKRTLHAQLLVLVNLDASAANMAKAYGKLVQQLQLALALQTPRIWIDTRAILPLNRTVGGSPRLIYAEQVADPSATATPGSMTGGSHAQALGSTDGGLPTIDPSKVPASGLGDPNVMAQVLQAALQQQYLVEDPNRSEQQNLAEFGLMIGQQVVYQPDGTDVSAVPVFAAPENLFIVLTLNHLRRPCGVNDVACQLGGQSPMAYFSATDLSGNALWLNFGPGASLPLSHIFHLAITTQEGVQGEDFYTRCSKQPGFPADYVDLIEPSPAAYYGPFAKAFQPSENVFSEDFCEMLGSNAMLRGFLDARQIASVASNHP